MAPTALLPLTLALSLGASLIPAAAADAERPSAEWITAEADRVITRGLDYLAARQQENGSFGAGPYGGNTAIAALAGMAFMSAGSTPGRGPYGKYIDRSLDYVLANAQESGFIAAPSAIDQGPMYGHGFATLFLAECYGMSARTELREKLTKAVRLVVTVQNAEGGWRYQPRRADADISVTVCQVMALRAARNAGIHVPPQTIDRAIEYVKKCQNADGGFMYMQPTGESAFARSAAGVVALYSAGVYEGAEIDKGIGYLMHYLPRSGTNRLGTESFYEYGHYYAVQAMWQQGGEKWQRWYPAIRDELISRQREDGSWFSNISVEYATAMSAIVLQIPNNCLPIFQR